MPSPVGRSWSLYLECNCKPTNREQSQQAPEATTAAAAAAARFRELWRVSCPSNDAKRLSRHAPDSPEHPRLWSSWRRCIGPLCLHMTRHTEGCIIYMVKFVLAIAQRMFCFIVPETEVLQSQNVGLITLEEERTSTEKQEWVCDKRVCEGVTGFNPKCIT